MLGLSLGISAISVLRNALASATKFLSRLKTSLVSDKGAPWTFSRNTTATVVDHEGVVRTARIGEARFQGMRRVENLFAKSENFADSYWGTYNSTKVGMTVVDGVLCMEVSQTADGNASFEALALPSDYAARKFSMKALVRAKTVGCKLRFGAGSSAGAWSADTPVPQSWTWISTTALTASGTIASIRNSSAALAQSFYIAAIQCEDVTSQSDQRPGEYQPTGTGGPIYGAELVNSFSPGSNWSGSSGRYTRSGASSTSNLTTDASVLEGKPYKIHFNLESISGEIYIYCGSSSYANFTTPGIKELTLFASGVSGIPLFTIQGIGASSCVVSEVSVKQGLYNGCGVDGVGYYSTRLDGTPIYEAVGPELMTDATIAHGGTGNIHDGTRKVYYQMTGPAVPNLYVYDDTMGGWVLVGNRVFYSTHEGITFLNNTGSSQTLLASAYSIRELKPLEGLGIELSPMAFGPVSAPVSTSSDLTAPLVVGNTYKVSWTARAAGGTVQVGVLNSAYGWQSGNPAITGSTTDVSGSFTFVASDTLGRAAIYPIGGSGVATVSVRQVTQGVGALIEPARTNSSYPSEMPDALAIEGGGAGTSTPNSGIAPNGTNTAVLISGVVGYFRQRNYGTAAATTYTHSIFLRAGAGSIQLLVGSTSQASGGCDVSFDPITGAYTGTGVVKVQKLAGGWWRLSATHTTLASGLGYLRVMLNGTSVYFWGLQDEAGASASTYIPATGASAVTRAADAGTAPVSVATLVNRFAYSADMTQHAADLQNSATATATVLTVPTTNNSGYRPSFHAANGWTPAVGNYTMAVVISSSNLPSVFLGVDPGDCTVTGAGPGTTALTATPTLVAIPVTVTAVGTVMRVQIFNQTGQAGTYTVGGVALIPGTVTAAQILAAGGIPLTTTAPNANTQGTWVVSLTPSGADAAGRYPAVALRGASAATDAFILSVSPALAAISLTPRSNGVTGTQPTLVSSPVAGVKYTIVISWNNGRIACFVNGVAGTVLTGQTMPLSLTTLDAKGDYEWFGNLTNERVFSTALPDATCLALSNT